MKILPHLNQKNQELEKLIDKSPLLESSYHSALFDDFLYSSCQSAVETVYQSFNEAVETGSTYMNAEYEEKTSSEYIDEAARNVALQSVEEEPQDLQVSREDWNKIKDELEEYGIDKKDIADLEERVMSEEGMTYGVLVAQLSGMMHKMDGVELNPFQKQNLNSIFAKLGFTPEESKAMLAGLSEGKMGDVLEKIQAKLASLSDTQTLQFSADEVDTLNSLFKISKTAG